MAAPAVEVERASALVPTESRSQLTMAEILVQKHDVTTNLNFFKPNPDGSPPEPTYAEKPETFFRDLDTQEVVIKDIAEEEHKYTLDGNGFQIYHSPATEREFFDEEKITGGYYAEIEKLLKDVTGADRVLVYDHAVRRPASEKQESGFRKPVQLVHIDQTYDSAVLRVAQLIPAEATDLLKGRFQIINVWRPIATIQRDPLAVADSNSVPEEDLVPRPLIYPDRRGETFSVKHSNGQKWYYRSGLAPEQVLFIKCFDSKTDGRARRTPHTAFHDPSIPTDAPPRESIEVRALVFHTKDLA